MENRTTFADKKFFTCLIKEITIANDLAPDLPADASTLKDYLPELIRAIEDRRNFAVMCLTPEKLVRANAPGLVKVIEGLTGLLNDLKASVKHIPAKKLKEELSDDDKRKIEQLIGRNSG